MDQELA
jgi:hypothetical protein